MQQDSIDCAAQAMEKFNIEKDIAACESLRSRPSAISPWRRRRPAHAARAHCVPGGRQRRGAARRDAARRSRRSGACSRGRGALTVRPHHPFRPARRHQEGVRQKVRPHLALRGRPQLRLLRDARDEELRVLLPGPGSWCMGAARARLVTERALREGAVGARRTGGVHGERAGFCVVLKPRGWRTRGNNERALPAEQSLSGSCGCSAGGAARVINGCGCPASSPRLCPAAAQLTVDVPPSPPPLPPSSRAGRRAALQERLEWS